MNIKFPLKIIVKAGSKENKINFYEGVCKVNIKAKAVKDQANKELIKFLSKYFGKRIRIVKGFKSKEKIIDIIK